MGFIHQMIVDAVAVWESKSCVRFPERTTETRYIEVVNGSGCSSYIGNPYSVQTLSLKMESRSSLRCMYVSQQLFKEDTQLCKFLKQSSQLCVWQAIGIHLASHYIQ